MTTAWTCGGCGATNGDGNANCGNCGRGKPYAVPGTSLRAAERRALLGDAVIAHIHREVAAAPPAPPEVAAALRAIFARPAERTVRPAAAQAA